jgi:RNA polymerase sigma-70 factor (ECF subfamily)
LGILNVEAILEIDINQKILLELITDMSNKLPEKCRLVFQYNKLQDMPLAEVAENLNISPKTAEGHLTKALRVIRANFDGPMSDLLLFMLVIRLFIK